MPRPATVVRIVPRGVLAGPSTQRAQCNARVLSVIGPGELRAQPDRARADLRARRAPR